MKNRNRTNLGFKVILALMVFIATINCLSAQSSTQPNILWLVIEDTSPQNIGCYGSSAVNTPNIDKLAEEGIRFTNAYSTGTSCAPSRSTIITGVRTYKMGTGNQRSTIPIPDFIKGFPYYLKEAGYYTTNNNKTDYNTSSEQTIIENSWHENSNTAGWEGREPGQPFFAVFNFYSSHQSRTMTDSYENYEKNVLDHLPDSLQVGENDFDMPPYLSDNSDMRKEYARMYNGVSLTDFNIGKKLQQLEDDKLKDSTIIFFYGDHGQGMPRIKTNGIGQGYKVPFVVWFPEMYKHLSPFGTGGIVTSEQINFSDLSATILSLAGIESPDYFDGRAFLGAYREEAPEYMFVSNDRVDNGLNTNRAIIKDSLVYIRNFTPFQPEQRYISYFMNGKICQLMYEDFIDGLLPAQQSFVFEKRAPEAFFNLYDDMWEMTNLIDVPEYADEIADMRAVLEQNIIQNKDIMLANEYDYANLAPTTTPYEYRLSEEYNITEIWEAASLSGFSGEDIKAAQLGQLDHGNDLVRYWAAIGLRSQEELDTDDLSAMSAHLDDSYAPAQIYLAAALYEKNKSEEAKAILEEYSESDDPNLSLMAMDNIQNMDSFIDFGNQVLKVYNETNGIGSLWNTHASASVLMYRLKLEDFEFSYGTSTIEEKDLVDFEEAIEVTPNFGCAFEIVENPDTTALNKTMNCGQVKRTSDKWYELIDIPMSFSVGIEEIAYLHIMVNYPSQPDIVLRPNQMGNEINIRSINAYTDFGQWQDLVFIIPGGETGLALNNLRFMGDCGFQNSPTGFVLDNTEKFGFLDEIIVNTSSSPRIPTEPEPDTTSIANSELKKDYKLCAANQCINYTSLDGQVKEVRIFDISGNLLYSENKSELIYHVPKTGLYIVAIDTNVEKILVL